MVPDAGKWFFHCHVSSHLRMGMRRSIPWRLNGRRRRTRAWLWLCAEGSGEPRSIAVQRLADHLVCDRDVFSNLKIEHTDSGEVGAVAERA